MRESRTSGFVRGAHSNMCPYRDPYLLVLRKPNSSHSDRGGTDRGGTAEGQTERYSCFDDPIGSVNVLSVPPALGSVSKFRRRPRLTTISWL